MHAGLQYNSKIQTKAKQDNRVLQNLFGHIIDASLQISFIVDKQGYNHTSDDGKNRATNQGKHFAKEPAGSGNNKAQQHALPVFFDKLHYKNLFPSKFIRCGYDASMITQKQDKEKLSIFIIR